MNEVCIESLAVRTYRVPAEQPESDGTFEWDHTDLVLVEVDAGGKQGLGWSYASPAAATLIYDSLRHAVVGRSVFDIQGAWAAMVHALRNAGIPGAGFMAVSAVDVALWDLQARCLGLCLAELFGGGRGEVQLYGSGGFTSYDDQQLCRQLARWATVCPLQAA